MPGFLVGNTVPFRPVELKIFDHGDAHSRGVEVPHDSVEGQPVEALPIGDLASFDLLDELGGVGRKPAFWLGNA